MLKKAPPHPLRLRSHLRQSGLRILPVYHNILRVSCLAALVMIDSANEATIQQKKKTMNDEGRESRTDLSRVQDGLHLS
jgi:hypothetical protein